MGFYIYVIKKLFLGRKFDFLLIILLFSSVFIYPLYEFEKSSNKVAVMLYGTSDTIDGADLETVYSMNEVVLVSCFNVNIVSVNDRHFLFVLANDLSKRVFSRFLIRGHFPSNSGEVLALDGWDISLNEKLVIDNVTYSVVGLVDVEIGEEIGLEANRPAIFMFDNGFFNSQQALLWVDPLASLDDLKVKLKTLFSENVLIILRRTKIERYYLMLDVIASVLASILVTYLYLHFSRVENAIFHVVGWGFRRIYIANALNLFLIMLIGHAVSLMISYVLFNYLFKLVFFMPLSIFYFFSTIPLGLLSLLVILRWIFIRKVKQVLFE